MNWGEHPMTEHNWHRQNILNDLAYESIEDVNIDKGEYSFDRVCSNCSERQRLMSTGWKTIE